MQRFEGRPVGPGRATNRGCSEPFTPVAEPVSSLLEGTAEGKSRPLPRKRAQANGGPAKPRSTPWGSPGEVARGLQLIPAAERAAAQPPAAPNSGPAGRAGGSPGGGAGGAAQAPPRPRSEGIALPVGGSPPALPLPTRPPG